MSGPNFFTRPHADIIHCSHILYKSGSRGSFVQTIVSTSKDFLDSFDRVSIIIRTVVGMSRPWDGSP